MHIEKYLFADKNSKSGVCGSEWSKGYVIQPK